MTYERDPIIELVTQRSDLTVASAEAFVAALDAGSDATDSGATRTPSSDPEAEAPAAGAEIAVMATAARVKCFILIRTNYDNTATRRKFRLASQSFLSAARTRLNTCPETRSAAQRRPNKHNKIA